VSLEIILVRHGQSAGNRDRVFTGHGPSPLTGLGQLQAEAVARALAARPVHAIYSSDLPRALETAAPLVRLAGIAPIPSPGLRERDVGRWTGLTFEEVQASWPEGWQALLSRDPDYRPPDGESHRDCGLRVGAFLDELCAHPPVGPAPVEEERPVVRVAVFSHGVAINHMLRHVLGVGPGHGQFFFMVDNASLCRFERRDDGGCRIFTVNDTAHLAGVVESTG
jgi:broad specificity phosphatase PhoE